MEYLSSVTDDLKTIDERDIRWVNVLERPELVRGTLGIAGDQVDFTKFPGEARREIAKYEQLAQREMENLYRNTSGCRLMFSTDSGRFLIKAQLKRRWGYRRMNLWNSSGFDVYEIRQGRYVHRTVIAPYEGQGTFAEETGCGAGEVCVYLPTYNCIEALYLGIEKGASLESVPREEGAPILFYGNSVTQGAAASRSGNAFPNIVQRMRNREIINLSCSSCCRGLESMGELMGRVNCEAIVIDYTRNAASAEALRESHERFYRQVRGRHREKLIVLMTSCHFNDWRDYVEYDEIVRNTYRRALERGEKVKLLDVMGLFRREEYSLAAVDGCHMNDIGMYRVAEALAGLL